MSADQKVYSLVFFQDGLMHRFAVTMEDFRKLITHGEINTPFIGDSVKVYNLDCLLKAERHR